jgi:hypothetical protein
VLKQNQSPAAFKRLVQRVLRESDITQAPKLLLLADSHPHLGHIRVFHGAYKFMVGLAAIQGPLYIAAQAQGIDVVQQVTPAITAIQLPTVLSLCSSCAHRSVVSQS